MRRKFTNLLVQRTYDTCMSARPAFAESGIGGAFHYGYLHPDERAVNEICGPAVSKERAAWAAGVDCRRQDDKDRVTGLKAVEVSIDARRMSGPALYSVARKGF